MDKIKIIREALESLYSKFQNGTEDFNYLSMNPQYWCYEADLIKTIEE